MTDQRPPTSALMAGVSVYLIWGFVAEYFQLLIDRGIPADVLLAHRVVWSTAFCLLVVFARKGVRPLLRIVKTGSLTGRLLISAVLIAANWLAFIYSIQTNQRTDAALGYFINPLVSVALAVLIVRETLSAVRWVSVALAFAGVAYIVIVTGGHVPWIAATLALSFAFYGLVRKFTPVEPIAGLAIETAMLLPFAVGYLIWQHAAHPIDIAPVTFALLMLAGVVTAIPLMLFGYAARRLPLSMIGFLQYIGPTCQLLMAVLYRHEPIRQKLPGFVLIWVALLIYSASAIRWRPRLIPSPGAPGEG